ncbi:hypothetical protein AWM75_03085 [Aerococcus urinaehominis]|uniref:protein-tyrosine-phosphatase n=1 Tax=Aerococcus urinaehominis TaxID=128944 RepID=A0A0X8FKL5_9LACT|nr:low molecular weight protein-tyrosine-phosphatase [Aerococcus urinaehominis]AMB99045.1 hypothetical protein AWM75_03085 [Aerococcus urinaehominis]SDM50591.1 protein-tyrosine phosphatase [Aerococcus urinaehominis]
MIKVCFVCLGNICRSPMAEAVMRDELKKRGLADQITVDSAATSSYNLGQPPHQGTQEILDRHHISSQGQFASKLTADMAEDFDYIIGMDDSNLDNMAKILGDQVKLYQLMDFTDQPGEIDDPYFTGNFELTYDKVKAGVDGLIGYLLANHSELSD